MTDRQEIERAALQWSTERNAPLWLMRARAESMLGDGDRITVRGCLHPYRSGVLSYVPSELSGALTRAYKIKVAMRDAARNAITDVRTRRGLDNKHVG